MEVTGPKNDLWLVKTVGLLSMSIGISLFIGWWKKEQSTLTTTIAVTNAIAFCSIDFYYFNKNILTKVYLYDGCVQLVFIGINFYLFFYNVRNSKEKNV